MAPATVQTGFPILANSAAAILATALTDERRALLFGPPGVGKSTLAKALAQALSQSGRDTWCICADPGSPAFGVPGAVSLGQWTSAGWSAVAIEALCTLDAGRFRLPLVSAVRCLSAQAPTGTLLVDGPGVVRGVAGTELLQSLVDAAEIDVVLALSHSDRVPPLAAELRALPVDVFVVAAASEAARPGKRVRARRRTQLWENYLSAGVERDIDLASVNVIGTPPPADVPSAWVGRQLAVLEQARTVTMGEVLEATEGRLRTQLAVDSIQPKTVMVRNAARNAEGLIETAAPFAAERLEYLPPPDVAPYSEADTGPRVVGRVGSLSVNLVNGVFGDPLLHLRLQHQRRSLLFDLGEGSRLPARIAHQVTDVFVTHAHADHISGFLWLLRSRTGDFPPCRLYGPPGLADHVEGFVRGIIWDRVGDRGPRFDIAELHANKLRHYRVQAAHPGPHPAGTTNVVDDVVLAEPGFRVRATVLDHGTPVLAFAFEPDRQINVRKDRLRARELTPGPWLGQLKRCLLADSLDALIQLPNGQTEAAARLDNDLTLVRPGKKLVYATDLADTADNRERLTKLAHGAHTFFCEAAFRECDVEQAQRTGHLTTRACGEIASAAAVARLVPFHFSRRYASDYQAVYDEISAVCSRVAVPRSFRQLNDA